MTFFLFFICTNPIRIKMEDSSNKLFLKFHGDRKVEHQNAFKRNSSSGSSISSSMSPNRRRRRSISSSNESLANSNRRSRSREYSHERSRRKYRGSDYKDSRSNSQTLNQKSFSPNWKVN